MNTQFDELTRNMAQPVTRRVAFKKLGAAAAALAFAKFGFPATQAITNGALDGNGHPNVGGFVWLKSLWPPNPAPLFIGSGTLIHPRVVLTAGHGTDLIETAIANGLMTIEDLLVSFATDVSAPATWRVISEVITHPDFISGGPNNGGGNIPIADVGVAILKEAVGALAPMPLPAAGFLDGLQAAGQLRSGSDQAKFDVVGYGVELGVNPGHPLFPPDGLRRVAQSEFRNLHERWLDVDQNVAHNLGGSGSGDSGGPTLWSDPATGISTLVAITSRGEESVDVKYRIDTAEALGFIQDVIAKVNRGEL